MILDQMGKLPLFRSKQKILGNGEVEFRYKRTTPQMEIWRWREAERKAYANRRRRYETELRRIRKFEEAGLATPRLIRTNPCVPSITIARYADLTDFVAVFEDPMIHLDTKTALYGEALQLLRSMHELGECHGDPYPKNFFQRKGGIYACDFENERDSPNPACTDVLLLTAGALHLMQDRHPLAVRQTLEALGRAYGPLDAYKLDKRDIGFLRRRFNVHDKLLARFDA